ncbi:MAG: hypothetical protein KKA60_00970 [Proteobacteria bacterium]|nr:hypothetical protein [Pseudomonadota bacterium]
MPLVTQRAQIAAKVEASEGTAESLSASEAILAGAWEFEPEIAMTARPAASASLSPFPRVAGGRRAKVSFAVEVKGSGAAGTAPEVSALLRGCGFSETVEAGVSVAYAPASSSIPSLTIGAYCDGKRYLLAGARGTVKIDMKAGEPAQYAFEFTGTSIVDADVALLSPTYDSTVPPAFMSASLALDSQAAVVETVGIDLANSLYLRPSANAAQGFVSAVITGREPKLTLNPEDVLVADHDWWAQWESGAFVAFTATLGSDAGNICTITAPAVQISTMKPADREGILIQEMECLLAGDNGDDELVLTFS